MGQASKGAQGWKACIYSQNSGSVVVPREAHILSLGGKRGGWAGSPNFKGKVIKQSKIMNKGEAGETLMETWQPHRSREGGSHSKEPT